jgi:error-prone DNA polymerase
MLERRWGSMRGRPAVWPRLFPTSALATPGLRWPNRLIFTTLDDGTGLVDLVFFHDSQEAVAYTVFHCWLVVVHGTLQRRGARSISIVGSRAWDLTALAQAHRDGGTANLHRLLAADLETPAGEPDPDQQILRGRPPGDSGRHLWHASPGSAG